MICKVCLCLVCKVIPVSCVVTCTVLPCVHINFFMYMYVVVKISCMYVVVRMKSGLLFVADRLLYKAISDLIQTLLDLGYKVIH